MRNRLFLFLYNLALPPVLLAMLPAALAKTRRRGGFAGTLPLRLGFPGESLLQRLGTGRIWIHAVSVGEVGIALKFCRAFHDRNPGIRFLLTATTPTGLSVASRDASDWLDVLPNPLDLPIVTSRLMRRLRPSALLMVEADLWPNRIAAAKSLGIPVALLNARLSPRSEGRFRLAGRLATALFGPLDLITLSDEGDPERWLRLGVRHPVLRLTGNMKHDGFAEPRPLPEGNHPPLLLAASTHPGEERVIARAWMRLRESYPDLGLVIAPRHAERRAEIRAELESLGLSCALRSEGGGISSTPLLLDTTGELSSWYPRASVVFVGKSLPQSANLGGQNMIEPLRAGIPVLTGPHTANFEPLATQLRQTGALLDVADEKGIESAVASLLANPEKRRAMIAATEAALRPHQGAVQRNCGLVESLLPSPSATILQP